MLDTLLEVLELLIDPPLGRAQDVVDGATEELRDRRRRRRLVILALGLLVAVGGAILLGALLESPLTAVLVGQSFFVAVVSFVVRLLRHLVERKPRVCELVVPNVRAVYSHHIIKP